MKLSPDARQIKKADAFALITDLKAGRQLLQTEIDSLLLYFCPPVPKTPKAAVDWIAKAAADPNKEKRKFLHYVHVFDGVGYASDGARAHWGPVDLADGAYWPCGMIPAESDGDCREIFGRLTSRSLPLEGRLEFTERGIQTKHKTTYRQVPGAVAVNEKFLLEAIRKTEPEGEVKFGPDHMAGEHDFGKWLIAGIRL